MSQQKKIIIIGLQGKDDYITLNCIAEWLEAVRQRADLTDRLYSNPGQYDVFDMKLYPERGDAFHAIDSETELVIALHLFGIDMLPKPGAREPADPYLYEGQNGFLLQLCMQLGIPLVCAGDQPWLGLQRKTKIRDQIWFYESEEPNATIRRRKNGESETIAPRN